MADITVTYSGSTILATDAGGTKTLKTSGKYCLDNIAVQFSPSPNNKINELINRTVSTYTNNNVTSIGDCAFASCPSLTAVSFPACTTIGEAAFASCPSLTAVSFPACTKISGYAFQYCSSLTTASFPACTTIGGSAFTSCSSLTTASFPVCTTIGGSAFTSCSSLTTASFPVCTTINSHAFTFCSSLTTASFPVCTTISDYAFRNCVRLKSLYLTNSSIATLASPNAFTSTPINGYSTTAAFGSIYVPSSLLASYKAATNWTYFSSRFVGI